jgi:hypothetical protein
MIHRQTRTQEFLIGIVGIVVLSFVSPTFAQQQSPSATESSSNSPSRASRETDPDKAVPSQTLLNTPNNDRLFGVLPNYATVENEHLFRPLSAKGKFKLSAESMLDPVTFPFIGFVALIGQAENSEPSYGQGMKGYAKRYGTSYADAGIGTTMTTSVLPALLRQDPRYFQLGKGSILYRSFYSVSRIFVTRTDTGGHQFNYSEIAGNMVAAGISNAYHPKDDRSLANTLSVWGTDIMWDTASNVAKEFWPDIHRKLRRKKT